jgi:long-chain acyl-CoA synthetase
MEQAGTLTEMFEAAARRYAGRPCLEFLGRSWNYAQVAALVARAGAGLQALGVARGDRVGLCLPNSLHYVVSYFAILRAGAVVVNFNPLSAEVELATQAHDSGVGVMITTDLAPVLGRMLALQDTRAISFVVACPFAAGLPLLKRIGFALTKRAMVSPIPTNRPGLWHWRALVEAAPAVAVAVKPDDLAVLQYTGGTTGAPTGVMLSHANLTTNAAQVRAWFPDSRPGQERVLAVLPLFHVFAMTVAMNAAIGWGAEIVLQPRFEFAMLLAALRRRRPSIIPGVPTLYKAILDKGATAADLASVRVCISGGAPLPHEIQSQFEAAAGCRLVEGYGLTEASPVCFCNPVKSGGRDGTIGLPLPGVEAQIRAIAPPHALQPHGTSGELWVRGPNVMQGYWHRPEETAATLMPDGWLRTGDVGIMDADGYVELIDRIKDLILCSGFNVYPRATEEALYRHHDVVGAIAVGMPDPYRGESVAAFVQLTPGSAATPETLRAFLDDKLSPIEMPRHIEIRATLPLTAIGKLSRKELRAELLATSPAQVQTPSTAVTQ